MSQRVQLEVQDHVAHVRLTRPVKHNGLDLAMFEAIIATGEALMVRKDVRVVVLSGEGPSFCAGLDFASFMQDPSMGAKLLAREGHIANVAQRVAYIWKELPMPVIAVLHGAVFGGGLQIALAADIRLAAAETRLSVMEMTYGLIPDMSITQTLFGLVGADVAAELIYTAKKISAEQAAALGLITRVVADPLAEAKALAAQIASRSPQAVRAAKELLKRAPNLAPAQALKLETDLQLPLLGSPNQLIAVQASFTKQTPVFSDPE